MEQNKHINTELVNYINNNNQVFNAVYVTLLKPEIQSFINTVISPKKDNNNIHYRIVVLKDLDFLNVNKIQVFEQKEMDYINKWLTNKRNEYYIFVYFSKTNSMYHTKINKNTQYETKQTNKNKTYYKLNKTVFQFMDIYRDYRLFIQK